MNCKAKELDEAAVRLLARVFDVYEQASPKIKEVILDMAHIINDPDAEEDERAAAIDTLKEALFPTIGKDGYGVDLDELTSE